ncbi:MAG: Ig-like domain-containing protein [Nitrososphaera sp.]
MSAYSMAVVAMMLLIGAYPHQSVWAFSYNISDAGSCLALSASAKARWDQQSLKCTIAGTLALSSQDMLTVGQGVMLVIEDRGKVTIQGGAVNNAFGATILVRGKVINAGTITNMGNITLPSAGSLANQGVFVNSSHGLLKSSGRITNTGTLVNHANATILSSGKFTNRAEVDNAGYIDNRGTMFMLENSTLAGSAGSVARNTGNVMIYCQARVTQVLSIRSAIDRCDDPPYAAMGSWLPDGPGSVGTEFTFYANATDDVRLAWLEWDFDGDGVGDYDMPLVSKVSTRVSASHTYASEGQYQPQVRAIDSAGQMSSWAKNAILDIAPANSVPVAHNATLTVANDAILHIMPNATDADGDKLEYYVLVQPAHGSLLGSAPDLTYQADEGYTGQDSFGFVASDGKDDSEIATVSVTVTWEGDGQPEAVEQQLAQEEEGEDEAPNTNPVAYSQTIEAREDAPASFRLTASDADGDWLQISIVILAANHYRSTLYTLSSGQCRPA